MDLCLLIFIVQMRIRHRRDLSRTSSKSKLQLENQTLLLATNHPRRNNFVQENKPDLDLSIFDCLPKILVCIRHCFRVEWKLNLI